MTTTNKIRVGPSLRRRTAPTHKRELTYGLIMSTFSGLINAIIPMIVNEFSLRKKHNDD